MSKQEIRKQIRSALLQISHVEMEKKSARICDAILQLAEWKDAKVVALFAPQPFEPNIDLLWEKESALQKELVYPRMQDEHLLLFPVKSLEHLTVSRWNLREPLSHCESTPPESVDLILVPGVAFSKEGYRLGRGKGFYDRLLARTKALKVGVCFEEQIAENLPMETHDHPVNHVITESGRIL